MISIRQRLFWGVVLYGAIVLAGCRKSTLQVETKSLGAKYHVGQEWSYKTRPVDGGSTLVIAKIEDDSKLGKIYHISVKQVKIKNSLAPGGFITEFPHLPMAETAIDKSVVKLLNETAEIPDFREGYREWRSAFDNHQAGIFTIPVSECLDIVEAAVAKKK